jgi:hypothetical protein
MERLSLSVCAYERILKVARTIADLAAADTIEPLTCSRPSNTAAWIGMCCINALRPPAFVYEGGFYSKVAKNAKLVYSLSDLGSFSRNFLLLRG